jgi:hypothetical protein
LFDIDAETDEGITGYQIESRTQHFTGSESAWAVLVSGMSFYEATGLEAQYVVPDLPLETTLKFWIRASNSWGWGPFSDEVVIKSPIEDETKAPESIKTSIVPSGDRKGDVMVTWKKEESSNASDYMVQFENSNEVFVDNTECDIVSHPYDANYFYCYVKM